jgi:hypothetical protein
VLLIDRGLDYRGGEVLLPDPASHPALPHTMQNPIRTRSCVRRPCRYDFLSRELEVATLESVKVEEVYDMFAKFLLRPSAAASAAGGDTAVAAARCGRKKLSVQVRPHGPLKAAAKDKTAASAQKAASDEKSDGEGGKGADEAPANGGGGGAQEAAAAVAAAEVEAAAPLPAMSEPGDLMSLRARLPPYPLHLGTPPAPVQC